MNKNTKGFIREVVLLVVVLILIMGLTGWNLKEKTEEKRELEEVGRVVEGMKTNPDDEELLRDLAREGNPFIYNPEVYERKQTGTDLNLLPTKSFSFDGVSFKYPPILSLNSTSDSSVSIKHTISSPPHTDFCDLSGRTSENLETVDDFSVSMRINNYGLVDAIRNDVFKGREDFFNEFVIDENNRIITEEGFISAYRFTEGNGYLIESGAEGCGTNTYVIPLEKEKTLIVEREIIPYTNYDGIKEKYLVLPGVIDREKEEYLFHLILQSIQHI